MALMEHHKEPAMSDDRSPHTLGMFAWFGVPVPFQDRMPMIRDAGFGTTCIWWSEDEGLRELRHLAPGVARDAGLAVDNIHVPYDKANDLWSPDDAVRRAAVDRHLSWVRDCARHAVPTMVMHVTRGNGLAAPDPRGIDGIRRIVDAAAELDVTIAIENTRRSVHLDAVFREIDSPNLKFCYDCGHDWCYSDAPFTALRNWGNRLATTHFSDNDGKRDQHRLPGTGRVDFDGMGRAFDWSAFDGVLMLEVLQEDKSEPTENFLARAYEAATQMRERLISCRESVVEAEPCSI